jgi:YVTN family beta-propeller protein
MPFFGIARVSVLGAVCFLCAAGLTAAAPFAYVANGGFGTVSVIDVETNAVVATISLPAGSSPGQLAVSPDGTRVYVSTGDALAVIDTATKSVVVPAIPVGFGTRHVAISPDGRFVYVAIQFEGRVTVVDTTTNAVVTTVDTGGQPTG